MEHYGLDRWIPALAWAAFVLWPLVEELIRPREERRKGVSRHSFLGWHQ